MTEAEFLPLFDRYHNMVYRLALTSLRSVQDAEDMVQTVFLKLLSSAAPRPRQGKGLAGPGDGQRLPGPGPGQETVGVGAFGREHPLFPAGGKRPLPGGDGPAGKAPGHRSPALL